MKTKLSALTILLILASVIIGYSVGTSFNAYEATVAFCIEDEKTPLTEEYELSLLNMIERDNNDLMQSACMSTEQSLSVQYSNLVWIWIVSILATILSWKFDKMEQIK